MRQIVCINCMSRVEIGAQQCPYCGHSFVNTNPAGALPVNTLLAGRYTLARCLHTDGEGIEYEAIDMETEQRVVVKEYIPVTICAARAADGRVIPRQGREVLYKTVCMDFVDLYQALLKLGSRPGLVTVLDLVEANNTAYAVREPDEGMSLTQYLEELRMPLGAQEALTLLSPVVQGVQAMHEAGLLHRGICPETVRITERGARLSGYATLGLRTAESEFKPKLPDGYAAPEQYSVAEFQGAYTDIYSLGALFYFAVTGRTPVPSNLRKVQDTLPQIHTITKQVPGYYSAAVSAAMRVVATERIQTAAELLSELTAAEGGATGFFASLTPRQWKLIAVGGAAFAAVIVLSAALLINALSGDTDASSASSASESVVSSASQAQQQALVVPSFKGQKYEEIIKRPDYLKNFVFVAEYEESSEVEKGVVIRQTPLAGAEAENGALVKLVVSEGRKTVIMPRAEGRDVNEVIADLSELGMKPPILNTVENNGDYIPNFVVKSNIAEGTEVNPEKDVVKLDVAGKKLDNNANIQGGAEANGNAGGHTGASGGQPGGAANNNAGGAQPGGSANNNTDGTQPGGNPSTDGTQQAGAGGGVNPPASTSPDQPSVPQNEAAVP